MKANSDSDIFVVCGFVRPDSSAPHFVVPVVKSLESGEHYVQVVSSDNKISDVIDWTKTFTKLNPLKLTHLKIGDDAIFGYESAVRGPSFGTFEELQFLLRKELSSGSLGDMPAFAYTVSKIVGDEQKEREYGRKLYKSNKHKSPKSSLFFLENNVVKSKLKQLDIVKNSVDVDSLKIAIRGDKVSIDLGTDASEPVRRAISETVTDIVRHYNETPGADISFDSKSDNAQAYLHGIASIRSGLIWPSESSFDLWATCATVGMRNAVVTIPEAFQTSHYRVRRRFQPDYALGSSSAPPPISRGTLSRIAKGEPVSLQMALLFRHWCFGNLDAALGTRQLILHISCVGPRRSEIKEAKQLLNHFAFSLTPDELITWATIPSSYLVYLHLIGKVDIDTLSNLFEFKSSGYTPAVSRLGDSEKGYSSFIQNEFPNVSRGIVHRVISNLNNYPDFIETEHD